MSCALGRRRQRSVEAIDGRSVLVEAGEELGPGEDAAGRSHAEALSREQERQVSRVGQPSLSRSDRRSAWLFPARHSGDPSVADAGTRRGLGNGIPSPERGDQQRDGGDRHHGAHEEPTGLGHEPMIGGDAVRTPPVNRSARVPRNPPDELSWRRSRQTAIRGSCRSASSSPASRRSSTRRSTTSRNGTTTRSALARVRDIAADPRVTILVDRWDEDWTRLAWLRAEGRATLLEPGAGHREHSAAVAALRAKYSQYETHRLEQRPLTRITIERVISWGSLEPGPTSRLP